jgi:hypothetical protein
MKEAFLGKSLQGKMDKKAQIEILGLAVLVIVLAIILIIALTFNLDDDAGKSDVRTGLIANNLLNALIKQEGKVNFKNLVFECYNNIKNGQNMEIGCNSLNKEINETVPLMIGNKKYELRFESDTEEFYKLGSCKRGIESIKYRFKSNGLTFISSIKLC